MQSGVITRDEDILGGIPVFTGTRVPVKTLFDYLKANHPLDDFPTVPRQQAQQALEQALKPPGSNCKSQAYETAA